MASPELNTQTIGRAHQARESNLGFYVVLLYVLMVMARPQDAIPVLRIIPFGTGLSVLILFLVLASGKLNFSRVQTKLWVPLLAVMAVHVPIAVNNYWALMVFKDMLLLFFAYLGIVIFVDTVVKMTTLIKVWLAASLFLAIWGIFHGGRGIGGWMGDENDFCLVMNMAIPFSYFLLLSARGGRQKIAYLAVLGSCTLAAMTSLSRGGFVGLASVGAHGWYRSPKKAIALIIVPLVVVFMMLFAPKTYWDEIASAFSEETMTVGTGADRLYTWEIGMEMFYSNPIVGVGQGNFPWAFSEYEGDRRFLSPDGPSRGGRAAHSVWVALVAELGLVGILIVGGMLFQCYKDLKVVRTRFAPVRSRWKGSPVTQAGEDMRAILARAMEGSLIGFIVTGVFISALWYPILWLMMALVVALRNISEDKEDGMVSPVVRPGDPHVILRR